MYKFGRPEAGGGGGGVKKNKTETFEQGALTCICSLNAAHESTVKY